MSEFPWAPVFMKTKQHILSLCLALPLVLQAAPADPKKAGERFKAGEISWPSSPGEAEICMWKDDKIAPVSVTVDDNWASEVPWWLEQSAKYGNFPVTWFIITQKVGGRSDGGTWALWSDVVARGNDVQSHTHTHLHTEDPGWIGIEAEYADSRKLIEENIPGHRARMLAYPGGPNSKLNSEEVAAKYYAGARWATGTLVPAGSLPYMGVRAVTESSFNNPAANWADPKRILDPSDKMYRTWCVMIYHGAGDKAADRPFFHWLADNKDKLWLSRFCDASLYGQEREAATVKVTENGPSKIEFELTDTLDNAMYDQPLTVKVRLPDGWKSVAATQGDQPVEAKLVTNDGSPYALVDAVPDKGKVSLVSR